MNLLLRQDRQAQRDLYQRYAPKMLSVCRTYVTDLHWAEDVLMMGFLKVFQNLEKFQNKGSFEGWIRRIMVNESISFLRKQKAIVYLEEHRACDPFELESEIDLTTEDIQRLLDRLPAGCRMVFNLYVIEQYKHREIASLLQIQEGTSKSQLAQARKLLQAELSKLKSSGLWSGIK